MPAPSSSSQRAKRCQERVEGFSCQEKTSSNILMGILKCESHKLHLCNDLIITRELVFVLESWDALFFGKFESKQFWQWWEWRSTKPRTQGIEADNSPSYSHKTIWAAMQREAATRKAKNWAFVRAHIKTNGYLKSGCGDQWGPGMSEADQWESSITRGRELCSVLGCEAHSKTQSFRHIT